jgi:hypothetical protein
MPQKSNAGGWDEGRKTSPTPSDPEEQEMSDEDEDFDEDDEDFDESDEEETDETADEE